MQMAKSSKLRHEERKPERLKGGDKEEVGSTLPAKAWKCQRSNMRAKATQLKPQQKHQR